jgi:hypothetical protein
MSKTLLTQPTLSVPDQPKSSSVDVKQIRVRSKGVVLSVPSVQIDHKVVFSSGRWLKTATVPEEELIEGETIPDPNSFVLQLKGSKLGADLFTFAQRVPDSKPKYNFDLVWEDAAVIPITTFTHWWKERTEYSIRKAVNRGKKLGLVTEATELSDDFAEGVTTIYNETPVRQGKAFWHYRKGTETVKSELATYLDRSTFIGAYYRGELVGSMKITYVGSAATIMQILSAKKHFDKRPNNALIAKAVEICELRKMSHLIYGSFVYQDPNSTLTEFKRRNGFEPLPLPRYYIPLTPLGKIALKMGFHKGLAGQLPKPLLSRLLKARKLWYSHKLKSIGENA